MSNLAKSADTHVMEADSSSHANNNIYQRTENQWRTCLWSEMIWRAAGIYDTQSDPGVSTHGAYNQLFLNDGEIIDINHTEMSHTSILKWNILLRGLIHYNRTAFSHCQHNKYGLLRGLALRVASLVPHLEVTL